MFSIFRRKYLYVNISNPQWREWRGVWVKNGMKRGEIIEMRLDDFDVLWNDTTFSTEQKNQYQLVFGD
jgi:hypothetical protein